METALPQPVRYWHKQDTASGRLERYLVSKGIQSIGEGKRYADTFINNGEDHRWPLMDLPEIDRAYRCYCVNKLSMEGLLKVQSYEQRKMLRFLTREEMAEISGEKIEPVVDCSRVQRLAMIEFSERTRPKISKTYGGFSVPAYFHMDLDFDGMDYHHAWDKIAKGTYFELPIGGRGKQLSEVV